MTDEPFTALVNGPLNHPLFPFRFTRLLLALKAVIDATGEAGEQAFEEHCRLRQAEDDRDSLEGFEGMPA